MSSINARFKNFLGSKKAPNNPRTPTPQHHQPQVSTPPPQLVGIIPNSASTSSSSLQMNQPPLNRPPSYSQASNNYPPRGIAPGQGRAPPTQIPGGPNPINTNNSMNNYSSQNAPSGPPPPVPYNPPQVAASNHPAQQYYNRNAVEVEGAGRSKAQLIVGIDFVSNYTNFVIV